MIYFEISFASMFLTMKINVMMTSRVLNSMMVKNQFIINFFNYNVNTIAKSLGEILTYRILTLTFSCVKQFDGKQRF